MHYVDIRDGTIKKYTKLELSDLRKYRRVLSDNERWELELLERLRPSREEVRKAKQTLEMIDILQGVI